MRKHFENIKLLHGNASVRIPNEIFIMLSSSIKSTKGTSNIQQVSFTYCYLILISFLYKYAHFVDINNRTYVQNSDMKEILGYNRGTKTVDKIIKKGGVLDELGITSTIKDFPVAFNKHSQKEVINGICIREYTFISEVAHESNYNIYKEAVKNRNYEVKEPLFITHGWEGREYGTLYATEKTHQVTIDELLHFIFDKKACPIDMIIFFYFKSKCRGFKNDMRTIPLEKILFEIGIEKKAFYRHIAFLKENKYIRINHKGWKANVSDSELNEYFWKGIR